MVAMIMVGDCRTSMRAMPAQSVNCVVTSPPYFGLRDYGHEGQIGLEATPDEFVAAMVEVAREIRRVLRDDGTFWLNLGDSYASTPRGNKPGDISTSSLTNPKRQDGVERGRADTAKASGLAHKQLIGIPWRVAFALQADGWYLRQDIIWAKPNPMPESVKDRCTKSHEYIFLLTKSPSYYFDHEANREPAVKGASGSTFTSGKTAAHQLDRAGSGPRVNDGMRTRRSVWTVATRPFKGAHFATFPPDLIEPCVLAGCPAGGIVLDPFGGAGTTGLVAEKHGRNSFLCELNPDYAQMAADRIGPNAVLLA